jgi:diacylglycerol kinase (ATP)
MSAKAMQTDPRVTVKSRLRGVVQRWFNAFGWSLKGLAAAWRNEMAFRQELLAILVMAPAALWLGTSAVQRALLIGCLLLVVVVELLNSAIESVVDRIGLELHPLSGQAKNLASAAVLVALVIAALVWGLIIWERWM